MNFSGADDDYSVLDHQDSLKELGIASTDAYFRKGAKLPLEAAGALERISQFVKTHCISLENFWKASRNHANINDIREFCEGVGINLTQQDQISLIESLFQNGAIVSVGEFVKRIDPWCHDSEHIIIEFMKNRAEKLADTMKKKQRLNSAQHLPSKHESSKVAQQPPAEQPKLRRPLSSKNFTTNKSKEYLRLQKQKEMEVQKRLQSAINKAKNEYEYELLVKMSQANDLNKQLQSITTYRAYKNAQGNLKVRVFSLDRFQRQLKLEEFQREFNTLKKRYNEIKKVSMWKMLSTTKNGTGAEPSAASASKNFKKAERQKELIGILTETMNLTNLLKGQLKILKQHGICPKS